MMRRVVLGSLLGGGLVAFGVFIYLAGWHAGAQAASQAVTLPIVAPVQNLPPIQEVIPLPVPDERQGRGQGQTQECDPVILFYYQGRLYQLQPGPQNRQGRPSSPPEYFPLRPYQGPQIPGLPFVPAPPGSIPQSPGFQPVNPRF